MSITLKLDLPDELASEARANGLLESASIGDLLAGELRRRKAAAELDRVLDGIRSQPGAAASVDDIVGEVKAVRASRRTREAGR